MEEAIEVSVSKCGLSIVVRTILIVCKDPDDPRSCLKLVLYDLRYGFLKVGVGQSPRLGLNGT